MKKYQLIKPPEEGWRGRMSVIAQILRSVFRPPEQIGAELKPIVEKIDQVIPDKPADRAPSRLAFDDK
jgi:hypothetical protein